MRITNTCLGGLFHSNLFVNIEVASKGFSRNIFYIDTTVSTNKYNKPLLVVLTKDWDDKGQLLAFGLMFDETEEGYLLLLKQLRKVLNFEPEVIHCDRSAQQLNALIQNFPKSHIQFCSLHIARNLLKYFNKTSPVYRLYKLFMFRKISEETLIKDGVKLLKITKANRVQMKMKK